MNKKLAALIAIMAVMTASTVSCGHDEENSVPELPSLSTNTEETTEEATEDETEKPTEAETEKTTAEENSEATVTTAVEEETDAPEINEPDTEEETNEESDQHTDTEQPVDPEPDPNSSVQENPTPEPEPEPEPEPIGGVTFGFDSLNSDASNIIAALGEPLDVQSAPACFSNGADSKIYNYDGLTIECYVLDDIENICTVTIIKEGYFTSEGICLGKTRADVEAAYGVGEEAGMYTIYYGNNGELDIRYSDDFVAEIVLYTEV